MDANQSKKLNEVNPKEVLEAVMSRKKKEFEIKFWEVKAQAQSQEECCLCPISEAIVKIDEYCTAFELPFRRQKPTESAKKKSGSKISKTSAQMNSSSKTDTKKSIQKDKIFDSRARRWETSEDESVSQQQSISQSAATCHACDENECFAQVNRCTRSTFDSSQLNNSFLEPNDALNEFTSGKQDSRKNNDSKCAQSNTQSSIFWNTPVYRKQSENFITNSVASALESKPSIFLSKSKSQKRNPILTEKETIENPPVVIELLTLKNDSPLKSSSIKQPLIGLSTLRTSPEKKVENESKSTASDYQLTQLDELILKHLSSGEADHKKSKSRFGFCNSITDCPEKELIMSPNSLLYNFETSDFDWRKPEDDSSQQPGWRKIILDCSFTKF